MSSLSVREMCDVQDFIDDVLEYLDYLGLDMEVDDDIWNWKHLLDSIPGSVGVSKTLDPASNDLRPGNSFWISLSEKSGSVIATQADRLIVTDDFMNDVVATHRLFSDRKPLVQYVPLRLNEELPKLSGRINLGGGIWVNPAWRGHDLGGLLSRLARAFALRHFLIDVYITLIEAGRKFNTACGFENATTMLDGYYPARGKEMIVTINWADKATVLEQLAATRYMAMVREEKERKIA